MARKGTNISKGVVRNLILRTAKKEGIALYKEQRKLIKLILITLPQRPNPCHLARWCNSDVKNLIGQYPRFQKDSWLIKNEVHKELLYLLNIDEFKRLAALLKHEKPENIRPEWIRDNAYALALSIRRGFKDRNGHIDWPFVFDKLGTNNFLRRRMVSYHNDKKKIVARLEEILAEKNPRTFNPNWIYKKTEGLDHHIGKSFNGWPELIAMLSEKWRLRWLDPNRRNIMFYEGQAEFDALWHRYRKSLYLLYAAESKLEKKQRNSIILKFVALAQKGNLLAWDLVMDSTKLTICTDEKLKKWQNFGDALNQRMRSAIINFNLLKGDDFYHYLNKGLGRSFPGISYKEAFVFHDNLRLD